VKTATIDKIPERVERPIFSEQMVLVECNGVRHLASQDEAGKWKTLSRHKELQGNVEVIKVVR